MTDQTGEGKTTMNGASSRALTPARIALGRSGSGLPTNEVLKFSLAHAQARDAVHITFDAAGLAAAIEAIGLPTQQVSSAAATRESYLRRPDLGRRLDDASPQTLEIYAAKRFDLAIVIADGLSSTAIEANAEPFLEAFLPHFSDWACPWLRSLSQSERGSPWAMKSVSGSKRAWPWS